MVRRDSTPTDSDAPTAGPSADDTADADGDEKRVIELFPAEMHALYFGISNALEGVALDSDRWTRLFDVYDRLFERFRDEWRGVTRFERRVEIVTPDPLVDDAVAGLRERADELAERGYYVEANQYRLIADKIEYQRRE